MMVLMKRWFSPGACECICSDIVLAKYNFDLIKEAYMYGFSGNDVAEGFFNTLNDEYTLIFTWSDHYISNDNHLIRICNISFKNNILGIVNNTISFSVDGAIVMLDNLSQYIDMNMDHLEFPIQGSSSITYMFTINTDKNINSPYYNNTSITIVESNPILHISSPIETFYLKDSQLEDFMYQIYFAFIIDIDSGDMSLMEAIYDKLIG